MDLKKMQGSHRRKLKEEEKWVTILSKKSLKEQKLSVQKQGGQVNGEKKETGHVAQLT